MTRAGFRVDVRIGADVANHLELGKTLQQRALDGSALADQYQRLGVFEPLRQNVNVLGVIVPDGDVMTGQLLEARHRLDGVLIIVKNRDFHVPGNHLIAERLSIPYRSRRD